MEILLNIAVCNSFLNDWAQVIVSTERILNDYDSTNYHAMYLRAKALVKLDRREEACIAINKALSIRNSRTLNTYLSVIAEKTNQSFEEDKKKDKCNKTLRNLQEKDNDKSKDI